MSIYQEIILDHYRNPRNYGTLTNPTKSIHVANPLCGDMLDIDIKEDNNVISEIRFRGQGCAISLAAASMLLENAQGKTKESLRALDSADMLGMIGIQLSPNRIKCALLALEGLSKLL